MRYLLDTHTFIWAVSLPEALSERARKIFEEPDSVLCLSVASSWEISIKAGIGKLSLPQETEHFLLHNIRKHGLEILAIILEDTFEAGRMPQYHKDPFDRILIAQSRNQGIPIITKDEQITQYDVETIW